jgi:Na+/H+-dicarboxylate symporter
MRLKQMEPQRLRVLGCKNSLVWEGVIYFEVMTTIALVVGLVLAFVFAPGHGMNINPATLDPKALNFIR